MMNLNELMADLNKKHGTILKKGTDLPPVSRIPFSSPRVNYMSYGGIPRGLSTEFFGPENGGKTTICLDIVAQAQRLANEEFNASLQELEERITALGDAKSNAKQVNKLTQELNELQERGAQKVVYLDAENTLNIKWAQLQGVDTDALILVRPQAETAETLLQIVLDLIDTGDVIALVIDSIPALVPKALYEKDMEGQVYGGIAKVLANFSAKVTPLLGRTNTALLIINQKRDNLANPYDRYHTSGGRALKHLSSMRFYVEKGELLDAKGNELKRSASEPCAHQVNLHIVKTKVCPPDRLTGYYTLNYTVGVDVVADTIDVAQWYNIIEKAGSWFKFLDKEGNVMTDEDKDEMKFQGKSALIEFLEDNPDFFNEIYQRVQDAMFTN